MITIFGTTYFTIGAGLIVLALAAPFLLWFSVWLLRPNIEDKPRSTRWLAIGGTTLALLLLIAVGLFWDVYLIGQRAKELCAETGLVAYRTEIARGFLGSTDIRSWARDGFHFVEDTVRGRRYRFQLRDGAEIRTEIPNFESNYELSTVVTTEGLTKTDIDKKFLVLTQVVTERSTKKTLGQLSSISIERGWIDRLAIDLLGLVSNPQTCGKDENGTVVFGNGRLGTDVLIKRTLMPK